MRFKVLVVSILGESHPKSLPESPPPYHVEFPPEELSPTNYDSGLRTADADALTLTLVNGLHLKKRRTDDESNNAHTEVLAAKKKYKTEDSLNNTALSGSFGSFSVGHYTPKKEAAGKPLPLPQQ